MDLIGFKIIKQIAVGSMATLYLALDERTEEKVAVKAARISNISDDARRRFIQEFTLLSRIDNQRIVDIKERYFDTDYAYIVMEYFPGGDLAGSINRGLKATEAIRFAYQIADGLTAVHEKGIVHRDLKPANILLRNEKSLAISDFGIAKLRGASIQLTGSQDIMGTPYYMSPEQFSNDAIDHRTDLYGLGVIFYEMLTGTRPYKASKLSDLIGMHINGPLPQLPKNLSLLQPLLDCLLQKDINDRIDSAQEFKAELMARVSKNRSSASDTTLSV